MQDQNPNTTEEEGTVILDPEMKAKQEEQQRKQAEEKEKLKELNTKVQSILGDFKEMGMKVYILGFQEEMDRLGMWKSDNISELEEMGFTQMAKTLGES